MIALYFNYDPIFWHEKTYSASNCAFTIDQNASPHDDVENISKNLNTRYNLSILWKGLQQVFKLYNFICHYNAACTVTNCRTKMKSITKILGPLFFFDITS